ncbi:hypothetical protein [Gordonia sp. (in: high G+C Gram-positive bacteria)]|uniref:hypothetical protein n=1 Tax=Gordonia sp. (in: high G+C Gram-positive bacteria) TaxID=84139 RepID=UPI003C72A8CF
MIAQKEIARLAEFYEELAEDCRESQRIADERADRQELLIGELREDVAKLQLRITKSESRFFVLLGHHRRVVDSHVQHAPGVPLPEPPESLREYL